MCAIALAWIGCQTAQKETKSTQEETKNNEVMEKTMTNEAVAVAAMKALFVDYNEEEAKALVAENYIQHNPGVPTGAGPVMGFIPVLKEAGTKATIHRTIVDGDLVAFHNTYSNADMFGAPEIVTFDVFRVQDGKVAEHWDGITPVVNETASGRTQVDGPTAIEDESKTEENKQLVENFMQDILFGKNPDALTDYVSTEMYHQHNTAIKDGLDGLGEALAYLASQNDMFIYEKIHQVIGQGNFVLVRSEGMWHGKKQAFNDLFRIKDGKIVEHWDIIQEIPAEMAHSNGMF